MDTTDPAPAPIASKEPERGKDILVSTSWWEVANHIQYGIRFTVRILGGITHYLSLIPLTLERSKDRLSLVPQPDFFLDHRQKIFRTLPITGEKYFVLYLRWLGEENF